MELLFHGKRDRRPKKAEMLMQKAAVACLFACAGRRCLSVFAVCAFDCATSVDSSHLSLDFDTQTAHHTQTQRSESLKCSRIRQKRNNKNVFNREMWAYLDNHSGITICFGSFR